MGLKLKSNRPLLKSISSIPMERELVKTMGEFFGRNIQNRKVETTNSESVIKIQEGNSLFEYHIDNMSIEEIKQILCIPQNQGAINLGRQANRMILTLLLKSAQQYKSGYEIEGEFRISEIIKIWGVSDGAKTRQGINDLLSSLYSSSFVRIQQIGKNEKITTIARPVPFITKHEKDGEETVYRYELSREVFGRTMDWIATGIMPKSWQNEGYLSLPITDISEKNQNVYYLNFRERLRLIGCPKNLKMVTTSISKDTLLISWFKFDRDRLKRRTFCRSTIITCLEEAKKANELQDFTFYLPENKNWRDEWSIKITKTNR